MHKLVLLFSCCMHTKCQLLAAIRLRQCDFCLRPRGAEQHVEESKLSWTSCGENICAEMKNEKKKWSGLCQVRAEGRSGFRPRKGFVHQLHASKAAYWVC
jgi:hypothetical protein